MITAADDYPLVDLMWTFVLFFALMLYLLDGHHGLR